MAATGPWTIAPRVRLDHVSGQRDPCAGGGPLPRELNIEPSRLGLARTSPGRKCTGMRASTGAMPLPDGTHTGTRTTLKTPLQPGQTSSTTSSGVAEHAADGTWPFGSTQFLLGPIGKPQTSSSFATLWSFQTSDGGSTDQIIELIGNNYEYKLLLLKVEGAGVNTIALASRFAGAVVEDMAQMRPTITTGHLRAPHTMRAVLRELSCTKQGKVPHYQSVR